MGASTDGWDRGCYRQERDEDIARRDPGGPLIADGASPADRAAAPRRVAVIYDDSVRPDTTGGYCLRALQAMTEAIHLSPDPERLSGEPGLDLYLCVDDGLEFAFPGHLHPSVFWAIDTHIHFARALARARAFDVVFAAQKEAVPRLRAEGIAACEWLPLACDPEVHQRLPLEKCWDVAFVGHVFPGPREQLLEQIRRHFPNSFIGQAPHTEMGRLYSQARIVINCSLANDLNMRVFEALSCGALLITNRLENNGQDDLFGDRVHLVAYRSQEEALDLISYYLQHDDDREAIAAAGHQEAIAKHTYRHRMERVLERVESLSAAGPAPATHSQPPAAAARSRMYYRWPRPDIMALVPQRARRILDVGCAAGVLGQELKRRQQCEVTGIELEPEAAAEARGRLDQVIEGDIEALDLSGLGCFEAVICGDVLEHLRHPGPVLAKLREVLSESGVLVASFPNARHIEVVRSLVEGNWTYQPEGVMDRDHLRFFTRRSAEQLLDDAGFDVVDVHSVPGPGYAGWQQAGRPVQIEAGRFALSRLSEQEAEEFFVDQWLMVARPLPKGDWGLTSIIIVTWNEASYTWRCIDSVRKHTHLPYELIVVDNGSTDATIEWVKMQPDIRLIENRSNLGFPKAANQGLQAARGDNLLLLNNDTVVTPGWLRRLLVHLHSAPEVGLVGPVSNFVSGAQQIPVPYQSLAELDGFAWTLGRARRGQSFPTERLVGFCLLLKREVMERVGLLDERFGIGCYEDDDFSLRAVQAGYQLLVCEDALVHHFGGRTFVGSGAPFSEVMRENEQRFREKWGLTPGEKPAPARAVVTPSAAPTQWRIGRHAQGGLSLEAAHPTISLCMIVRDEEPRLRACLESIRPFVDEMIVVDTGSKDRTAEIARTLGAKVIETTWQDSFSAARNLSLDHATGDWIFWLDADDVIDEKSGQALRQAAETAREEVLGFVAQVHCPSAPGEAGETVVDHVKLFRNRPDLRFELRIHEQILMSIRRAGGEIARAPIHVLHANYDHSPEGQRKKRERDRRLLELDLQENPKHPFVHFNVGMTALHEKEYERAIQHLRTSITLSPPGDSQVRKAYALLAAAHRAMNQTQRARQACEEGLGIYPDDPELLFNRALVSQSCGQLREAESDLLRLLGGGGRGEYLASMDIGILSYKAEHNLGIVYQQLGERAKACSRWRNVVEQHPEFLPGWLALLQSSLEERCPEEAEALVQSAQRAGQEPVAALLEGRLAMQHGDLAAAVSAFRRATRLAPDVDEGHRSLSHALLQRGERVEVEAVLRRLIQLAPDDAEAHYNLGSLLMEHGRPQEAVSCYEEALRSRPGYRDAHEMLLRARLQARGPAAADGAGESAVPGADGTAKG